MINFENGFMTIISSTIDNWKIKTEKKICSKFCLNDQIWKFQGKSLNIIRISI